MQHQVEITRCSGRAITLAVLGCVILGACAPDGPTRPQRPAVDAASGFVIQPIDAEGYRDLIEANRGKVVLVDFWATWCSSCLELMTHQAALAERLAQRGLVVVTLSLDELDNPEDAGQQAAIRAALARHATPSMIHCIARPGLPGRPESDPFRVFDIPGGALPHLKLYDRGGVLRTTFDSQVKVVDPTAVARTVEALLEAPPTP